MSFPEPFSPRGRAAASGPDPMPGAFTGQARDLPAPLEFPPIPAAQLLALIPEMAPRTETAADLPPPEPPMVPVETAFRLQELVIALARPRPAAAPDPAPPVPADFLLTALADQLQSRFTHPEPAEDEGLDLLSEPLRRSSWTPAPPTVPPSPAPVVPPDPGKPELAAGLAALLPSLGLKSTLPAGAAVPAVPSRLIEKPLPPAKPVTVHQGDVFFMEPAASAGETGQATDSEAIDFFGAPAGPDEDGRDGMDLMDAPDLTAAPAALTEAAAAKPPWQQAEPLLPPPLPAVSPPAPSAPAPSAPAPSAPVPSAPAAPALPAESGLGLILGGTGLILLGIYFACQLPVFWLNLEEGTAWARQKTLAALVLHAAAALTSLTLGTGSVLMRRWAPPLIHAAGWIAALTASGVIAVTGFHLVNADAEAALPDTAHLVGLLAALLIPLACIFYYQQESAAAACEAAAPASWTDGLPVPALMVGLTGLALTVGAGAMLCHQPAFALALEPPLTGPAATGAWAALGMLGLGIACGVRLKHGAALWLLLLAALALAATLSPAAFTGGAPWQQFLTALGAPSASGPFPSPSPVPLLSALLPAPLLLVFAMARRSFSSPPPP